MFDPRLTERFVGVGGLGFVVPGVPGQWKLRDASPGDIDGIRLYADGRLFLKQPDLAYQLLSSGMLLTLGSWTLQRQSGDPSSLVGFWVNDDPAYPSFYFSQNDGIELHQGLQSYAFAYTAGTNTIERWRYTATVAQDTSTLTVSVNYATNRASAEIALNGTELLMTLDDGTVLTYDQEAPY